MSDRAKALVNLATSIHKVSSVADCFHFKYCINKLLCLSLCSKLRSLQPDKGQEATSDYAQVNFYNDLYVESMGNISQILHPFIDGAVPNTSDKVVDALHDELSKIQQVITGCEISDRYGLFSKAESQITDVAQVIDLWHGIVEQEIEKMQLSQEQREYLLVVLPLCYWQQAAKKTKHTPTRERLRKQFQKCRQPNEAHGLSVEQEVEIKQKAQQLCRKFQRASSQVEGRNGHLSLINHNQRGFNDGRLKVLTVVHNYDTKGLDGKTPAQRLFGQHVDFEPLFEYIIKNIGELPMPRRRKVQITEN